RELDRIFAGLESVADVESLVADDFLRLKRLGLSDAQIASAAGTTETAVRARRRDCGVKPAYRRVDSCAGEVEAASNYYYSTWGEGDEAPPTGNRPRVVILGSGPNRIGQGIEFDYCCVHAATTYRELGYEAVMVNCNPETASPDEAVEIAERIGYPVLVRPSYVLGGRAMRVCYTADDVRDMPRFASVLVDRFVENAIEVDVDALCDGVDTYVAAVMQHVEEA